MATTGLSTVNDHAHQTIDGARCRISFFFLLLRRERGGVFWDMVSRGWSCCGVIIIFLDYFTLNLGKSIYGKRFEVKLTRKLEVVIEFDRAISVNEGERIEQYSRNIHGTLVDKVDDHMSLTNFETNFQKR